MKFYQFDVIRSKLVLPRDQVRTNDSIRTVTWGCAKICLEWGSTDHCPVGILTTFSSSTVKISQNACIKGLIWRFPLMPQNSHWHIISEELLSWKWRGPRSGSEVLNESSWQQCWHEKEPMSPILYRSHIQAFKTWGFDRNFWM